MSNYFGHFGCPGTSRKGKTPEHQLVFQAASGPRKHGVRTQAPHLANWDWADPRTVTITTQRTILGILRPDYVLTQGRLL